MAQATHIATDKEKKQVIKWNKIKDFLNTYYHQPDFISLRICLAQYATHFYLNDPPVWSFILGQSSSGKSAIVINAISRLPYVHQVSTLGINSFLSGYGEKSGLLKNMEKIDGISNGILAFNDFSTFLGLREDTRKDLQGQLRDMFNGRLSKEVGNKSTSLSWEGKVTIMAACTNSLERHWTLGNDLGERFIYSRYASPNMHDDDEIVDAIIAQSQNNSVLTRQEYTDLVSGYADYQSFEPITLSKNYIKENGLYVLAKFVEICRTSVIRDNYAPGRPITDIEDTAIPTRLLQSALQIAKGSATINHREQPNAFDLKLTRKILLDTMPLRRSRIIKYIVKGIKQNKLSVENSELIAALGIPKISAGRELGNFEALNLLTITRDKFTKMPTKVTVTPFLHQLIKDSKTFDD